MILSLAHRPARGRGDAAVRALLRRLRWVFILVPVISACLHPKVLNPLLNKLFKLIKRPRPRASGHRLRCWRKALAWSFARLGRQRPADLDSRRQARRPGRQDHPDRPRRLRVRLVRRLRDRLRPGRRRRPRRPAHRRPRARAPLRARPWRWPWSPARSTRSATCSWRASPRRAAVARARLPREKTRPRSRLRPPPRSARRRTAARTAELPTAHAGQSTRSAAENLVPGLGGFLLGLPPPLVAPVPVDGRGQSRAEVAVDRLPSELGADLAGVIGVAQVVAGPVGYVVVGRLGPAQSVPG